MYRFLFLFLILLSSCNTREQTYRLVHANDADSCYVTEYDCKHDCKQIELRLVGIDAPEYSQDPWGKRALEFMLERIKPDTKLYLEYGIESVDKYGRSLVFLHYEGADKRKRLYNQELLANGFAVLFTFDQRQKYLNQFKTALAQAKTQELNIWDPVAGLKISPYNYRKQNRRNKLQ